MFIVSDTPPPPKQGEGNSASRRISNRKTNSPYKCYPDAGDAHVPAPPPKRLNLDDSGGDFTSSKDGSPPRDKTPICNDIEPDEDECQ